MSDNVINKFISLINQQNEKLKIYFLKIDNNINLKPLNNEALNQMNAIVTQG